MKWSVVLLAFLGGVIFSGCDCGNEDSRWLNLEIEVPEEGGHVSFYPHYHWNSEPDLDENGMLTHTYIVPPSFLSSAPGIGNSDAAAPDPFAPPIDPPKLPDIVRYPSIYRFYPKRVTAKAVLEAYGVIFGPGSRARYDPATSTLRVTNTPDQMDLVEAIIGGCGHSGVELSLSINFAFFDMAEAKALEWERHAAEQPEHSHAYEAVLDEVRQGNARVATTARILARSGQRSRTSDGEAVRVFRGYSEGKEPLPAFAIENVGTKVEVDPVIGPDNRTIDMNIHIRHHLAPVDWKTFEGNIQKPVFSVGSITRSLLMWDEQIRFLGSWEVPTGDGGSGERIRRLVFVSPTIVGSH